MLVDDTSKIYVGQTEITKAYQGTDIIYEKSSPLPYTPLNYLEANGLQKIDTGYTPNANTTIDITFMITSTGNERCIFASKWDLNGFVLMDYGSGLRWHNHPSTWYNFGYNNLNQYGRTLNIYQNILSINTVNVVLGTYTNINYTNTIKLFGFSNQHPSYCRIYEYKISENGTVLHDLIPVLDANSTPCMYDTITGQYHYNVGSGTFLYG